MYKAFLFHEMLHHLLVYYQNFISIYINNAETGNM